MVGQRRLMRLALRLPSLAGQRAVAVHDFVVFPKSSAYSVSQPNDLMAWVSLGRFCPCGDDWRGARTPFLPCQILIETRADLAHHHHQPRLSSAPLNNAANRHKRGIPNAAPQPFLWHKGTLATRPKNSRLCAHHKKTRSLLPSYTNSHTGNLDRSYPDASPCPPGEPLHTMADGAASKYITLISADDYEFVVLREAALISPVIRSMLEKRGEACFLISV